MGLFYAYLKNNQDDVTYRYLITFVNAEVADEWWRTISTFPSPYAGNVKRISPQFYTQNVHKNNVATTFFSQREIPNAKEFLEKMFFTLLHDRDSRVLSTIQPIDVTDHISGKWYFIRSKADPRRYWYFRIDGECLVCGDTNCDTIHISTEYRTRFQIQARLNLAYKAFQVPNDFVMIGKDEISIAASKDYILRINDEEKLQATKKQRVDSDLLFGDLKDRFVTRTETQEGGGKIWELVVPVERGLGEAWELFN